MGKSECLWVSVHFGMECLVALAGVVYVYESACEGPWGAIVKPIYGDIVFLKCLSLTLHNNVIILVDVPQL